MTLSLSGSRTTKTRKSDEHPFAYHSDDDAEVIINSRLGGSPATSGLTTKSSRQKTDQVSKLSSQAFPGTTRTARMQSLLRQRWPFSLRLSLLPVLLVSLLLASVSCTQVSKPIFCQQLMRLVSGFLEWEKVKRTFLFIYCQLFAVVLFALHVSRAVGIMGSH